jgi:hypothetical protein
MWTSQSPGLFKTTKEPCTSCMWTFFLSFLQQKNHAQAGNYLACFWIDRAMKGSGLHVYKQATRIGY